MRVALLGKPLTVVTAAVMFAVPVRFSDPVAIYATIDRVVLAPDANPTTIQIFGTFSMSDQQMGDHYQPATKGYLYYTLNPSDARAVRAEWSDLKSSAGKKAIVAFGGKYVRGGYGHVRCATEAPANPDAYPFASGMGVSTMAGERNTGWPIAKNLLEKAVPSKCSK